jgi:cis-3-alkyl-4-acyloxetan-2-one decarboxylase
MSPMTDHLLPPDARPVLVLLHGWPDTAALWAGTVGVLQRDHRCVCLNLPAYQPGDTLQPLSVDAMCDWLAAQVDAISPNAAVTLVLHDWGCFFGYEYAARHRHRVARVVGVDVGDTNSGAYRRSVSASQGLQIMGYQLWLALAWKLGPLWPALANGLTRRMARWVGWRGDLATVHWAMNYPYAMQWLGSLGGLRGVARVDQVLGPVLPTLFIYGRRKPFMFHSQRWVDTLNATPGCRAVGMDTGHWVMRERPDEFNAQVRAWLDAQRPPAQTPSACATR